MDSTPPLTPTVDDRFLIYQPNHGIGMELYLLHTAFDLAAMLNRTLIVPRLPKLETTDYQGGIDDYFEMPAGVNWVGQAEHLVRSGPRIDELIQVIPTYRPEYRSPLNRARHPVWEDNILRFGYFARTGFDVQGGVRTIDVTDVLERSEVPRLLRSDAKVLAISYLNGLVAEPPEVHPVHDDDFNGRRFTSPGPRAQYLRRVTDVFDGPPQQAFHVRRGYADLAWEVSGVRLPAFDEFRAHRGVSADRSTYVASDVDEVRDGLAAAFPRTVLMPRVDFTEDAVTDIAGCLLAETFVGTHFSTFTQYISHLRRIAGVPTERTILLREPDRPADHQYTEYDFAERTR